MHEHERQFGHLAAVPVASQVHPGRKVDLGLHLLALNGGNVLRAQRLLHAEGIIAPEGAIYGWMRIYEIRYLEIQGECAEGIGQRVAARALELTMKAMDAEEACIEQTMARIDEYPQEISPGVPATSARSQP